MDDNSNVENNENVSDELLRKEEDFSILISRVIELYKDDKLLEASRVLSSSDDIRNIIHKESEGTRNDLNPCEKIPKQENHSRENTSGEHATAFLTEHEILHEILIKSLIAKELIQKSESHRLKYNYVDKKDQDWIETGIYYNPFASEMSYRLISVENPPTNSTDPSRTTKSSLECQCVSVIPVSLLQSLLVVLNETELYTKWIPSFTFPKFGIHSLTKLNQCGRVGQELSIVMNVPWPLKQRAVRRLKVWIFDDIDHQNVIGIKIQNEPCSNDDGSSTSSSSSNNVGESVVDIAVDGGFLIRPCPKDHPLYTASTSGHLKQKKHSSDSQEDQILITFNASVDPQISIIPPSVFNFFTKVAFKQCWKMLLQIAVDVQNNKRLDHQKAIQEKKELYNWIEKRLQVLFADSSEEKDATVEARHKKREVESSFTTSTATMITDPAKMMT